jgi:HK97 family phage prohead protease
MTKYKRSIAIELGQRLAGPDGRPVFACTLSTEQPVRRSDWQHGAYDEVLSHKPGAVDLGRAPFPVLVAHDRHGLPVGIVENLRVSGGKLRGEVRFGESVSAREIEADVASGIIRNLSVGYSIEATEERKSGDTRTITATRWTPHELSVVAVGADAGAGFGRTLMNENENENPTETTDTRDAPALMERERCAGITRTVRALQLDPQLGEQLIRDGVPLEEARSRMIDAYANARPPHVSDAGRVRTWEPSSAPGRAGRSTDTGPDFRAAASDALLLRAGLPVKQPHPAAADVGGNLYDIARTCISRAGQTVHGSSPAALMSRAMATGDFPLILADVTHKALRRGYEDEPASHRQWVRAVPVSDFRDQHRPILGSAPDLEQVNEGGEYTHGSLDEDSTSYRVAKYGKIVALTWETIVNDNLSAFLRVQPSLGQAARRKEAATVYDLLADNSYSGPTMQDGVVLFHADHGNLADAGGMDAATLGPARALLRKQTAVGGGYLSLVPRFLIVPADLETDAEILMASATRAISSTVEADMPQWIARLELVVEPRLPDDAYYLAADSAQIDTVEMGLLEENMGGPMLEEEREFGRDVIRWKVRHVFGAKVLDWRGLVKVPVSGGA